MIDRHGISTSTVPVYCMCVYECCKSGGMLVLLSVFIMNYNTPINPQASIGPVRGVAAPLAPRARITGCHMTKKTRPGSPAPFRAHWPRGRQTSFLCGVNVSSNIFFITISNTFG